MAISSTANRRISATESFKTAADCIGNVEKQMSLFAITRGQFSMIDAVLHVLDCVGPAKLSIWTWAIADYEIQQFNRMKDDGRLLDGLLVIDRSAKKRNFELIKDWQNQFGQQSVRYVYNHSKIATVENDNFKVLLRGSMNLNFNPRFEQLDVTEGGCDFDLVKQVESELLFLPDNCSDADIRKSSKISQSFEPESLKVFSGVKAWAK